MIRLSQIKFIGIAVLGWYGFSGLLKLFWAYYAIHNPLLSWAIENFLPEHRTFFYILIYTHDVSVNILLALPVGFFFSKILPHKSWSCIFIATVIVFVSDYWGVLSSRESTIYFLTNLSALIGIAMALGLLPFVYFIACHVRSKSEN